MKTRCGSTYWTSSWCHGGSDGLSSLSDYDFSKPCLWENITEFSDGDVEITFSESSPATAGAGHFVGEALLFEQAEQGRDDLVITFQAEQFFVVVEFAMDSVA